MKGAHQVSTPTAIHAPARTWFEVGPWFVSRETEGPSAGRGLQRGDACGEFGYGSLEGSQALLNDRRGVMRGQPPIVIE